MINYNIENTKLSDKKLYITGWAFCDGKELEIKVADDKGNEIKHKSERLKRNDVYKYFNNNEYALNSGLLIEIDLKHARLKALNISFVDENNNVMEQYRIDLKKLKENDIKNKISYENLKKIYKSIRKDGIGITYSKVINKFKNIETGDNSQKVIEPYIFVDEKFNYTSNSSVRLIINSTNKIYSLENYLETLNSIKSEGFKNIINIYNSDNADLVLNNKDKLGAEYVECNDVLESNADVLKYARTNNMLESNMYYTIISAEDVFARSAYNRILEGIDTSNSKVITYNEDRLLNGGYIAPLYKKDAINLKRDFNIIFRKGLVINESRIDDYVNRNIDYSEIYTIDKVLYHYRVNDKAGKSNVKPIAFYLPQYHCIPENDEWWGEGFTEWTNVRKGKPLFEGHYQPHVPGELGYYNLVEDKTIQYKQIELAKEYGVYGFCYYYYWFNGKRLLEKPLDNLLQDKGLDFPFCICWANETWSRRWDGQEKEVLIKQEHNQETDVKFINDVIPILKDPRYIRVNGAPILLIYRAELFPDLSSTIKKWKEICKENGIEDLHVSLVQSFGLTDPTIYGGDSAVEFPPHGIITGEISKSMPNLVKDFCGNIYDYRDVVARYVNKSPDHYKQFRGTMLSWDNTARRGSCSNVFNYANPEEYRKWLTGIIDYTTNYNDESEQFVFINAWNEWAEGTHLEPDEKYGTEYLEATEKSLHSNY